MTRIALTGGIAAGKSTVADRLAEIGALVIDSDRLAREVVEPGTDGLAEVVAAFGEGILAADGSLDRPALGERVFADEEARRTLEGIIHPLVRARAAQLEAEAGPGQPVVHDIPLLVETGRAEEFDRVLVVETPEAERVERMVRDRGMAPEEARARIAAQASDAERRAAADVVLLNDGSREELRAAVDELWPSITGP
ncbi:dephospho-CoA kinase [Kytococcus aerolatus]|uniref:Dephospho-CoA kinase n=1 Tax=Kytococcus aerolatus TaxID=592308 RepID=A0A212T085_9MICO|nr:dephospho-CoA kinase [Kytococcus aerolatus]SNC59429.1 dephospho-CoA kinase [Kytococcus aerolatus]